MKTLICASNSILYLSKPPTTRPKIPSFQPTTIKDKLKPRANAKGFSASNGIEPASKKANNKKNNEDDEIPQEVFNRMIVRILVSVGVPMGLGLAFLHIFGVLKEQHLWDVPLWLPFTTTFLTFGASALGIAYQPTTIKDKLKPRANAKGFSASNGIEPASKKANNKKNNEDDEIPQEVFNRMIVRILVSVGVPMGLGLAFLHIFGVLKEQHLWDVPLWLPFTTTFLTFGASALGIAYGSLSTSLDAERKGSVLGFEEVQRNWVEMWKEEDESHT